MVETNSEDRENNALVVLGKGFDSNKNSPSTKVKRVLYKTVGKKPPRTRPSVEMRLTILANVLLDRKDRDRHRKRKPRFYTGGAVAGEEFGSEAEYMRNISHNMSRRLRRGFSSTESDARRTTENMTNTKRLLDESRIEVADIITTSFHGDRALEDARAAGINVGKVYNAEEIIKAQGGRMAEIAVKYEHSWRRKKEAALDGVINFASHNRVGRVGLDIATSVLRRK